VELKDDYEGLAHVIVGGKGFEHMVVHSILGMRVVE